MTSPPDTPEYLAANETVELPTPKPSETSVGRYRLIEKIGAGGMGEVFLADDPLLGRRVALKTLPAQFTRDAERVRRFVREAKAASALNHPNIITILDIAEAGEVHYIVAEYIQGQTLRRRMGDWMTIESALEVAIQMANALKAAHEAGIVHRDIKPENVMVRPDGLVKLLDFGIAKLVEKPSLHEPEDEPPDESSPGMILGTVSYMPPELLRGQKADSRSDIFSLGVVLYEMITGKSPFAASTQADVMWAILNQEPTPLVDYRPETPPELGRIVSKALEKERDARYQRVEDMLIELTDLKHELEFQAKLEESGRHGQATGSHEDGTTSLERITSEIRQHKRGAILVMTIMVLTATALIYLAYARYSENADSAITSIAVLPFRNLSNDPEKEYLSDGISESLINRLSQLPGLKVIANSSSSRYKDQPAADPREVARALNITSILTGRISQLSESFLISVELIDGRDGTQVWGERYTRAATDLVRLEVEISSEIAEKLRLRLTAGHQAQLEAGAKVNPEAYELLLKGRFHRSKGTMEDWKKAAEYFNQAILVDPGYALAYAELSDMYKGLGSANPEEFFPKADAAAQKALELDEGLAEAHYALANLKRDAWEWAEAEREYKRAIELNPNLALAHRWYASYLRVMGSFDEAIAEIRRARELDPLNLAVNANVGQTLYYARRFDQAIEALELAREMDRNYPRLPLYLGNTYAAKGMYADAIDEYKKAIGLGLGTPTTQIFLGAAYAQSGDLQQAEAILKQVQASKQYVSPGELAILLASMGNRDQAFALLEKAYQAHDLQMQYLGSDPAYDPLRSDARFQDLLRRIGLTAYT